MSRELSIKLLCNPEVRRYIDAEVLTDLYLTTKLCAIAGAFEELFADDQDEELKAMVFAGLPTAFIRSARSSQAAVDVVSGLREKMLGVLGMVDIATAAYEQKRDEDRKAEQALLAAEQAKREAEQLRIEREAQEAAGRRAAHDQRVAENQRLEAALLAEEEAAKADASRRRRQQEAEASREADEIAASSAIESDLDVNPLTQQQLEEMPIAGSGLESGIVTELAKSNITTVGMLLAIEQSGKAFDDAFPSGGASRIGVKSDKKISQWLDGLKARVTE